MDDINVAIARNGFEPIGTADLALTPDNLETEITWIYNRDEHKFDQMFIATRYRERPGGLFLPEGQLIDVMDPVEMGPDNLGDFQAAMSETGNRNEEAMHYQVELLTINPNLYLDTSPEGVDILHTTAMSKIRHRRSNKVFTYRAARTKAIAMSKLMDVPLPSYLQ